jgi:hypothetical protein
MSNVGPILRHDCPPKLYKYFAPERYSFFTDLRVRYSQLGAFNDPFEGRPEITSLSNKEDILATMSRVLPEEIKRAYDQLPPHVRPAISFNQVLALAEHLAKVKEPEMLGALQSIGSVAGSFFTGKIDQLLGVFCLSEVPDSLLMWAHYASSHTGFVVEFDALHPSFHERKSDEDDLRHIRRVYYRDARPSAPLSDMSAIELFLVKSGHWGYEREWRIVRPLADAIATVPTLPYPIALFEAPPAAVTGVIMGCRMSDQAAATLRQAVLANSTLSSLRIRRAVADSSHFLLRFEDDI